jgi:hypothetical protein
MKGPGLIIRATGRFLLAFRLAAILVAATGVGLFWFLRNPILPPAIPDVSHKTDPGRMERHVRFLASLAPPRNAQNVDGLNQAAAYIEAGFAGTGCRLRAQSFEVNHIEYKNVICSFGPEAAPLVVIGAHYDVSGDLNPGADDNASGVAGLLELARLIETMAPLLTHRIDLVAFTLEEPPHFYTERMGSYVYAQQLHDDDVPLKLMISVEMIGYFSDQAASQRFPLGMLGWFYPSKGNFIGVVGRAFERSLVARMKALMTVSPDLPVYSINAPQFVTGVDLSDHWSFWQFGFPAVMVTDTAFFRNPNYHRSTDRPETLDYRRMAHTVDGLYQVAVNF